MATIKFGANTLQNFEPERGDTVQQAYDHVRDFYTMDPIDSYDVMVNRREANVNTPIDGNATVEFVQRAGAKA